MGQGYGFVGQGFTPVRSSMPAMQAPQQPIPGPTEGHAPHSCLLPTSDRGGVLLATGPLASNCSGWQEDQSPAGRHGGASSCWIHQPATAPQPHWSVTSGRVLTHPAPLSELTQKLPD